MREAIKDAKKNKHHFGAVVVKGNKIISKAGKRPVGDPRYHAETQAIINATNKLKTKSLKGHTLYTTCEPCPMCFYMAWITNVSKIVFGASNNDSIKHGFKEIKITDRELNKRGGNRIKIEGGFLRDECLKLFKV
ncbi:MAG: nucleoside deaminase [Candidatus Zapsychrus exili]|nr:nucleoside deaminase [Candidatus Zapsychrus exili]